MGDGPHTCQRCKGAGGSRPVHRNYGDGRGEWVDWMDCSECGGSGTWSDERYRRWERGQDIKRLRIARQQSLYEVAKRLGVSPAELCGIEEGREPTTEAGRKAIRELTDDSAR